MTARRTLVVQGRQGISVTVVVEVYRGKVWMVSFDPSFSVEAIFEPTQADRLSVLLAQTSKEARGDAQEQSS